MMKHLHWILGVGLGFSFTALATPAAGPIQRSSPIMVGEVVMGMKHCLYAQAQAITDQFQTGFDKINLAPEPDWSTDEYDGSTSYGQDDESDFNANRAEFYPSIPLTGTWVLGTCSGMFAGFGFENNFKDEKIINYTKYSHCTNSGNGDNDNLDGSGLEIPIGSIPRVVYDKANRSTTYSNTGSHTEAMDMIKNLTLIPSNSKTPKVQFSNSQSHHSANVYFNVDTYTSCLTEKLGF